MAPSLRPLTPVLSITLLAGLCLLASPFAHAADPTQSAAAALQVLTQAHEATAQAAHTEPSRETLQVKRSETLDMLVHRLYPGWPLKDEVLRRALADLNPHALPNAANNLLKRGSTLVLPNPEDIRRTLLRHYPTAASTLLPGAGGPDAEADPGRSGPAMAMPQGQDKRRWVRFP